MLNTRTWVAVVACLALAACDRLSPLERKIIGAWSWTYAKGEVGRMVFTPDHKVKEGFPPEKNPDRPLRDDDYTYIASGTWRLEGDVLVTEMDNRLLVDRFDPENRDKPEFKKEVRRQKIVKIDSAKMLFDDGYWLDRVRQ